MDRAADTTASCGYGQGARRKRLRQVYTGAGMRLEHGECTLNDGLVLGPDESREQPQVRGDDDGHKKVCGDDLTGGKVLPSWHALPRARFSAPGNSGVRCWTPTLTWWAGYVL